jgi:tetratricopeptide (TPR) repeat protein
LLTGPSIPTANTQKKPIGDLDTWLHGRDADTLSHTHQAPNASRDDSLNAPKEARDRRTATLFMEKGEDFMKNGEQISAIEHYEKAIDSDPTWPTPRYELARVQALSGQPAQALAALKGLVSLATVSGDNLLRQARVAPEFEKMHADALFREATRFVPVEVAPARGTKNPKLVAALVAGLRARMIPAHAGDTWKGKEQATTVYYTKRSTRAEEAALEVVRVASLPPRVVSSKYLSSKRPVVLVLVESDTTSAGSFLTNKRLDDFYGLPVNAIGAEGDKHRLSLDKTGFFVWKIVFETGAVEERTGRYHVSSNRLSLSYRIVHWSPEGSEEETEQGRRNSFQLQLREEGLVLDGLEFKLTSHRSPPAKP